MNKNFLKIFLEKLALFIKEKSIKIKLALFIFIVETSAEELLWRDEVFCCMCLCCVCICIMVSLIRLCCHLQEMFGPYTELTV